MVCLLKAGVMQMCSGLCPEANLASIAAFAKQAKSRGAHYLLTPEMSVGFGESSAQLNRIAQKFEGNQALARCGKIAEENTLFLHIGSLAIALEDGRFANRSVLFGPDGAMLDYYDKIHLFDADIAGDDAYRESNTYEAGSCAVLTKMGNIKLGMSICYDVRFGELYRLLARGGAHMISVPAAFTVPTGIAHWHVLLRARAIETGSYILAAAQGGIHENSRQTYGHSMIIDPWGEVVGELANQSEGLIIAELDFDNVVRARQSIPVLANNAKFCLSVNHVEV